MKVVRVRAKVREKDTQPEYKRGRPYDIVSY